MSRSPTPAEIKTQMEKIGGSSGDYFAAQAFLQNELDAADRAFEKLKSEIVKSDVEPSPIEPTADQILAEARNFGLSNDTAREKLRDKLAADAKRLASFSASAWAEISQALAEASAARERAENVLAEHEVALNAVTNGIFALGKIRQKISVVKALLLSNDEKRNLA